MNSPNITGTTVYGNAAIENNESRVSAISWGAILGGAFAASSLMLILIAFGSGIGLASASPYSSAGVSAGAITAAGAIWLIVVQWLSAGLGGYLTGRLRTKWVDVHTHEVFFRDTVNGFLAWAVGAVLGAFLLASAAGSLAGGAAHIAAGVGAGAAIAPSESGPHAAAAHDEGGPVGYLVDTLFRTPQPSPNAGDPEVRSETTHILMNGLKNGDVSADDKAYLAQLVSNRTGISQPEAQQRVDSVIAQAKDAAAKAKEAADEARKAASKIAFFTAFSMLVGAFIAAAAGALGGYHRDDHPDNLAR